MCKFVVLFLQLGRRRENVQNRELKGKEEKALRGMQHPGIYELSQTMLLKSKTRGMRSHSQPQVPPTRHATLWRCRLWGKQNSRREGGERAARGRLSPRLSLAGVCAAYPTQVLQPSTVTILGKDATLPSEVDPLSPTVPP